MRFKFLLLLFIGLFSIFSGEIKSEEKVCKYSDPTTFVNCKKNEKSKIAPEYPLNTQIPNWRIFTYIPMWTGNSPILNYGYVGNTYEIVEIGSKSGKTLDITMGDKKVGFAGLSENLINKKTYSIPGKYVISWNYDDKTNYITYPPSKGFKTSKFYLSFIDNSNNNKKIEFFRLTHGKFKNEMLDDFLLEITSLQNGEERSYEDLLLKKFKNMEKRLIIIKNIVSDKEANESNCLRLNEVKFPELSNEFKKLSKKINPLSKKLNLPETDEFKNICGELPGERPLWMVEKIKGCYKYPTKKQRDYCINVYSPYGKE